jgi:hypothetical protein
MNFFASEEAQKINEKENPKGKREPLSLWPWDFLPW